VAPAPTGFVQNLKDCSGKYLQNDLFADQFVPKSFLADKPNSLPKPGPSDGAQSQKNGPNEQPRPAPPKKIEDPPVYFDTTVTGANGVKKYRYQILKDGTYKYLGELKDDGTLIPAAPGTIAPPVPRDDEKKGDRVIRS